MAAHDPMGMRPVLKAGNDVSPTRHGRPKGHGFWSGKINNKERLRPFVHLTQEITAHRLPARKGFTHAVVHDQAHLGAQ